MEVILDKNRSFEFPVYLVSHRSRFPSKMDRGLGLVYRGSDRGAAGA